MFLRIFDTLLVLAVTLACILCYTADKHWIADLAVHWRLHMAVVALFFVLLYMYRARLLLAGWMLLLTSVFAIPALMALSPAEPYGKVRDTITLLQFNICYCNTELAENAIPWILAQDADIVILQEVNAARSNELGELKARYPWSRIDINNGRDAFGKAIFSRLPVLNYRLIPTRQRWNFYASLLLQLPSGTPLHLYEIHTPPPVKEAFAVQRDHELELMGQLLEDDKAPYRLLVGDLNSTAYSPHFRQMWVRSGLHHAQQGYRLEGTWPTFLPMLLRIGIDHLLASPQIQIESRHVGPTLGSDHAPVLYTLKVYE